VRIEIPETGQVRVGDLLVSAANIWTREPVGRVDGPTALSVQLAIGDAPPLDLQQGDEVDIGGETWTVEELTEDPAHRRGNVVLVRV
jgi:Family of unknown function (DUF6406)